MAEAGVRRFDSLVYLFDSCLLLFISLGYISLHHRRFLFSSGPSRCPGRSVSLPDNHPLPDYFREAFLFSTWNIHFQGSFERIAVMATQQRGRLDSISRRTFVWN